MDEIVEIKAQLADHEARIKGVEGGQEQLREDIRSTNKLMSEMETRQSNNVHDVRDELKQELQRMSERAEKRDAEMKQIVANALHKTKQKMPDWGRYLIDALIVLAGSSVFVWMGKLLK